MTDQIHQWMDENSFNFISKIDNTIDEDWFLRDVQENFSTGNILEIFWSWNGWGGN